MDRFIHLEAKESIQDRKQFGRTYRYVSEKPVREGDSMIICYKTEMNLICVLGRILESRSVRLRKLIVGVAGKPMTHFFNTRGHCLDSAGRIFRLPLELWNPRLIPPIPELMPILTTGDRVFVPLLPQPNASKYTYPW